MQIFTIQEAAKILGCSEQNLRYLAKTRKIEFQKIGKSWFITKEDFTEFYNSISEKRRQKFAKNGKKRENKKNSPQQQGQGIFPFMQDIYKKNL